MMPWGHFAVAYVPYALYRIAVHRDLPTKRTTLLLLFATQLPDLIDKPLAWGLHLLPSGRSMAHSVLFAVPLVLVVGLLAWRNDRARIGTVFAFGYLSHLYADFYRTVLYAPPEYQVVHLANLYWPLLPVEPTETTAFLPYFTRIPVDRYVVVLAGLAALVVVYAYPTARDVIRRASTGTDGASTPRP